MKYKVYLAGPIENSPDKGRGWRKEISDYCIQNHPLIEIYDPVAIEDGNLQPFKDRFDFSHGKIKEGSINPDHVSVMQRIVHTDLAAVGNSDLLFLNYDDVKSWGSAGELTHAFCKGIPTHTVIKPDLPLEQVQSWVLGCSNYLYYDIPVLEAFKYAIKSLDKVKVDDYI